MIHSRVGIACFLGLALCAGIAAPLAAQEDPKFDVHEWSVWIVDPTLDMANHADHFSSLMPGAVDSNRPRASERGPLSPLHLLTFHGEEVPDLEVDLRVESGRFLAWWPPVDVRNNRLRWFEIALTAEPAADARMARVDERHWFGQARAIGALHVRQGARGERFMAYDPELSLTAPLRLEGGPDAYQLINLSPHELLDVLVLLPTADGLRIGRVETLPAASPASLLPAQPAAVPAADAVAAPATPAAAEEAAAKEQAAAAAAAAAANEAALKVAAAAGVVVVDAAAAPTATVYVPPADVPGAPPVEVAMAAPLSAESSELVAERAAWRARLEATGLAADEVALLAQLYEAPLFETEKLLVVFRLPADIVEQRLPLVFYPAPRRTVRVPLVVVRNVDPSIKDEVQTLVAGLGAEDYAAREAAEQRLWELGRLALPALKQALQSPDLETVYRAERLLLRHGLPVDGS